PRLAPGERVPARAVVPRVWCLHWGWNRKWGTKSLPRPGLRAQDDHPQWYRRRDRGEGSPADSPAARAERLTQLYTPRRVSPLMTTPDDFRPIRYSQRGRSLTFELFAPRPGAPP